jgi:hypothetical protein
MKLKLKKIITICLIVINIFSLTALPVYADMTQVMLGNPMGLVDTVFSELGVDKEEVQNAMKTVSVSRRKVNPPTVSLTFDPTDPIPGEKVTVTAMPTYFMNTTKNLYFTWYIKSKQCEDSANRAKCDLDTDGDVDIEDYKIKAARLLANNDFVWQPEDTVYSQDNHKDSNTDGYVSVFGGDDQREKSEHCFVHDVASGDNYEMETCKHLFPNAPGNETGDGEFGREEEKFWHTDPNNKDTASTGNTDEANVAGLGENTVSFTYAAGDKIGVAVEGVAVQPTQEEDSSYMTMWALTKNKCDPTHDEDNAGYPKTTGPTATPYANMNGDVATANYTTTRTVTTVQEIVPDTQVNDNATIRTKTTTRTVITRIDPLDPSTIIPVSDTTAYTSTCPASTTELGGSISEDGHTYTCTGSDVYQQGLTITDMDSDDLNACLESNLITPAEGGGTTEKLDVSLSYLPENPINDSSDESGENKNGDEVTFTATVANPNNSAYLNYTWEIYAGDDVSDPDSWKVLPASTLNLTGIDASQTSGLGITTFKFKLNFKDADFTSVTTTGKLPKYLKVKVTAKETLAEGSGEREGHTDITMPISSSEERIRVYTAKINVDNINFPAERADQAGLDAQERCLFTDPETGTKTPSAVCEVAKDEIVGVGINNGSESNPTYTEFLWTIDGATQVCPDENFSLCLSSDGKSTERTYFPILKEPGDSYTVGLSALNKETGERIDLTRVFQVSTPEVKIVPTEKDAAENYICRGLLLGKYQDFNTGQFSYEDRSNTNFQARIGNNLELTPVFSGTVGTLDFQDVAGSPSNCPYQWTVDGVTINADNATEYGFSIDTKNYGKLTLPPKASGEKYVISLSTVFTPTNGAKQMLSKYWNITYNEFYERRLNHEIEIEMLDTDAEISQKTNSPRKILATVSSGLPGYTAFLFRMVLSGMAIILALKIIFFILPKTKFDEF